MTALLGQAGRFAVVGVAATLVHLASAVGLVELFRVTPLTANFAAFCLALILSYLANHSWTFGAAGRHAIHFPRFATVAVAGLVMNQAIMYAVVELLGESYLLALAVVVVVVPAASFLAHRIWAFGHKAPSGPIGQSSGRTL